MRDGSKGDGGGQSERGPVRVKCNDVYTRTCIMKTNTFILTLKLIKVNK